MGTEWVRGRPTITAPDALARIAQALETGPIFGRHHHLAGGRSADTWAFQSLAAFQEYLARSKPGDLYQIWSLPALLRRQMVLLAVQFGTRADAETGHLVTRGLQAVKAYLDVPYNEFLALYLRAETPAIAVRLNDRDGFADLLADVERYSGPGSAIYVLPFTRIEAYEYILLEAKYPDVEGRVPVGGPD